MNITSLCLNVEIKINSNYPDWGPPRILLYAIARIWMLDNFYRKITNLTWCLQ